MTLVGHPEANAGCQDQAAGHERRNGVQSRSETVVAHSVNARPGSGQCWSVGRYRAAATCAHRQAVVASRFAPCPVLPVATLHLAAVNQKCKPPPGGSTVASLELKGIDGTRHTAWRVRLNSMEREKRTRARLSLERSVRLSFGVLRGGAWSLSVREVKCPLNCTNGHDRRASFTLRTAFVSGAEGAAHSRSVMLCEAPGRARTTRAGATG